MCKIGVKLCITLLRVVMNTMIAFLVKQNSIHMAFITIIIIINTNPTPVIDMSIRWDVSALLCVGGAMIVTTVAAMVVVAYITSTLAIILSM